MGFPPQFKDSRQVVQALSNGLRSDLDVAKATDLALPRVNAALKELMRRQCVVESSSGLFGLTDRGKDMVKAANAANRRR
jgi:predicted methyltransferase